MTRNKIFQLKCLRQKLSILQFIRRISFFEEFLDFDFINNEVFFSQIFVSKFLHHINLYSYSNEKTASVSYTRLKRQKFIAKYFSVGEALEHSVSEEQIIQNCKQRHGFRFRYLRAIKQKLGMSTWKISVIANTFCYFCRFMVLIKLI